MIISPMQCNLFVNIGNIRKSNLWVDILTSPENEPLVNKFCRISHGWIQTNTRILTQMHTKNWLFVHEHWCTNKQTNRNTANVHCAYMLFYQKWYFNFSQMSQPNSIYFSLQLNKKQVVKICHFAPLGTIRTTFNWS